MVTKFSFSYINFRHANVYTFLRKLMNLFFNQKKTVSLSWKSYSRKNSAYITVANFTTDKNVRHSVARLNELSQDRRRRMFCSRARHVMSWRWVFVPVFVVPFPTVFPTNAFPTPIMENNRPVSANNVTKSWNETISVFTITDEPAHSHTKMLHKSSLL